MPNPDRSFESCCIYIPATGLVAYNQPNGKQIARLELGPSDSNGEVYKALVKTESQYQELSTSSLYMVGYEVMALVYVDTQEGFVKTGDGYWIKVEELESKGLAVTSWMSYLLNKGDVLGWYAKHPGLNLRAAPTTDSNILVTLTGDLWAITLTKETEGYWCKVEAKEYRKHPCSGEDDLVIRTLTGWIKVLSEEQTPNIWNYGKGC